MFPSRVFVSSLVVNSTGMSEMGSDLPEEVKYTAKRQQALQVRIDNPPNFWGAKGPTGPETPKKIKVTRKQLKSDSGPCGRPWSSENVTQK